MTGTCYAQQNRWVKKRVRADDMRESGGGSQGSGAAKGQVDARPPRRGCPRRLQSCRPLGSMKVCAGQKYVISFHALKFVHESARTCT